MNVLNSIRKFWSLSLKHVCCMGSLEREVIKPSHMKPVWKPAHQKRNTVFFSFFKSRKQMFGHFTIRINQVLSYLFAWVCEMQKPSSSMHWLTIFHSSVPATSQTALTFFLQQLRFGRINAIVTRIQRQIESQVKYCSLKSDRKTYRMETSRR